MAPMAGVTDKIFRQIVFAFGAGFTVSEMVSAKSIVYGSKNTFRLMANGENVRPWAVQFFSHEPEFLSEAIKRLGDFPFDIVDINMGCPMPKIVNNGEGAALMKNPPLAGRLIAAAVKASPRPVTVKIRKGFTPSTANAVEMAHVAQESGAMWVAVHGRTRDQFYSGEADWNAIAEVKQAVKIPVIGNGDIFTPQIAAERLKCCDAIMLARGALGNPWLFSRTKALLETGTLPPPPTHAEIIETALQHLHAAEKEGNNIVEMRKHLCWYTKGLHGSAEARRLINAAKSATEMEEILRSVLNEEDFCQ
ncbi:MAG: tRNA dihydrouridine synthase DusB [Defluviitaleaceae bacterium]|nr:tRNA dihydrouridine synthase DusB [Defluviitaleaceae bacterium]MCL2262739.1 tRNA dihydrouridine synthase DusB [Defluviitaleaceae bacterium]